MKYPILILLLTLLISCGGTPMASNLFSGKDRNPPVLLDYRISSDEGLVLIFNEPTVLKGDSLLVEPPAPLFLVQGDQSREITLEFDELCIPGLAYKIHFDALDEWGNENWFIVEFYGPNPRLPEVLINEISPNGSSTRPDMIELYVKTSGNTAGLTLFVGVEDRGFPSWTFAEMEWQAGEYIILHCRPEGLPEEVSEVNQDFDLSGGIRAENGIRDLWAPEDMNLPGTSGIVSLTGSPAKGLPLDRIIYTNRLDNTEDKYMGWTSALWLQINSLIGKDFDGRGWFWEGEVIMPSDTVWSDDTTSTRTLCRNDLSFDSDKEEDWHTVPTSSSSFGFVNDNQIYAVEND